MNHKRVLCAILLALTLTAGMTACGNTGSSGTSGTESAAESTAESSTETEKVKHKRGKETNDGKLITDEELLIVPDEITLNGTKTKVSWTETNGVMRIQAVTGEIDGKTYTILESGTVPASYIQYQNEHENAYMFGVSGHAVDVEIFQNGTADYVINISTDQCIMLKVSPNDVTEKEAKQLFKDFDATAELYDTLIVDFINASEIKWD